MRSKKLSFKDKRIIITGGSSGLGIGLARSLASQGACLTLVARNQEKLQAAAVAIQREIPTARIHVCAADVTDTEAVMAAISQSVETYGRIDMLFNNAGIMREGRFDRISSETFREVMETNFFAVETVTRAALPYLVRTGGRVVNVASVAGLTGPFGFSAYASAKHALVGLSSCLLYELKPIGVQIHVVCPAEFESAMVVDLDRHRSPQNQAHVSTIPRVDLDTVVQSTLAGIRRGTFCIVPGVRTRLALLAVRLFPLITNWVVEKRLERASTLNESPSEHQP